MSKDRNPAFSPAQPPTRGVEHQRALDALNDYVEASEKGQIPIVQAEEGIGERKILLGRSSLSPKAVKRGRGLGL